MRTGKEWVQQTWRKNACSLLLIRIDESKATSVPFTESSQCEFIST